ncbi:MAG: galactokinase [Bacilli bacterium]
MDLKRLVEKAEQKFSSKPMMLFFAPGRVNLIGEHLDYNGGYVLPCAIDLGVYGVVAPRCDSIVSCFSENVAYLGIIAFSLTNISYDKNHGWVNYVKGMLKETNATKGFDLYVYGNLPNGAGLSSSAALEILVGTIVNHLENKQMSPQTLALKGQKAENEFIGVQCGIMDQFVIANSQDGYAMLLNTDNLSFSFVTAAFLDYELVIGNTNKKRALSDSKYNERRKECEQGLNILKNVVDVPFLCALTIPELEKYGKSITDQTIFRRVKHVVTENDRVLKAYDALQKHNLILFGQLLNASHESLKDDYQVTGFELDTLVSLFRAYGAIGARMTGAGFGGCMIALMPQKNLNNNLMEIKQEYQQITHLSPDFYLVKAGKGANQYGY